MSSGKQSTNYVGMLIVGSLSSSLGIMLFLLSYTPRTTCSGMLSSIVPETPPHQLKVKKFLIEAGGGGPRLDLPILSPSKSPTYSNSFLFPLKYEVSTASRLKL